ncbi:MAG: co-chaperone GroES [Deltaproteobacteria bacterium]|nr:co-chaperone GroES [Deltaproteobacteria bacterium]
MGIRPMNDKILVIRIEEEEKTSGGIIIPDTAKEKPHEGKVVAVGTGKTNKKGHRVPLEVKKGDQVLFAVYAGTEITISGVEHLIMQEDDILGIVQ